MTNFSPALLEIEHLSHTPTVLSLFIRFYLINLFTFIYFVVLGFEFRASHLVGGCSTA
jgi:hypothetical protein